MSEAERLAERLEAVIRPKSDAYEGWDLRLRNPDGPEAATLIRSQSARIAELQGLIDAQGVGHVTRTWVNEKGHYCLEIIPDAEFFARKALGKRSE